MRGTRWIVIETREQYNAILRRVARLTRAGRRRTLDETKLFRLLGVLIQDYDRRHTSRAPVIPAGVSGQTPADLLAIFEAINGKRPISAAQARKPGEMFRLNSGYFL